MPNQMASVSTMADSPERMVTFKDRTFERGRGCWNCLHWDNGENAKTNYRLRTDRTPLLGRIGDLGDVSSPDLSRELGNLVRAGYTPQEGVEILIRERKMAAPRAAIFDRMADQGAIGLCRGGGVDKNDNPVDFVAFGYLCHKWNGRDGHSVATAGKPLDKLPDELAEIAEGRAKKV